MTSCSSPRHRGIKHGYRSGLEEEVAKQFHQRNLPDNYERDTIEWISDPHKYHPDFCLKEGVYVETKGRFLPEDRKKHLKVKAQHPHLEVRFVFSNPNARLSKTSRTTYAQWCDKHGFRWAAKRIPEEWFQQ